MYSRHHMMRGATMRRVHCNMLPIRKIASDFGECMLLQASTHLATAVWSPLLHLHLPTEPRPYQTPVLRSADASRFRAATWMSIFIVSLVAAFYMAVLFSIFWPKEGG